MPLPFDLPTVSRAHAALEPGARRLGRPVAGAVAASLSELLGWEVAIDGRLLAHAPGLGIAVGRLAVELPAASAAALLEVEAALVASIVDGLGGGAGSGLAGRLTPLEQAALELLGCAALEGVQRVAPVAERLAPRLVRDAPAPAGALVLELAVRAGSASGRAWLHLPAPALEALARPGGAGDGPLAWPDGWATTGSLRGPVVPLRPEELAALELGDLLLTDPPPGGRHRLAFPGGLTLEGTVTEEGLQVEVAEVRALPAELPVLLEVELARVPVALGELARMGPGAVLPLPIDRSGQVALRLGERPIARGELVDLEGCVAVRILALERGP